MFTDLISDLTQDTIVNLIVSRDADVFVDNLELEDGNDYLLEDGGNILLE